MFRYLSCLGMIFSLLLGSSCGESASDAGASVQWMTSYAKALEQSRQTGKPILADFTGSDWCPPCKALKKRVFNSPDFARWASQKVILLEVDFPRWVPQDQDLKEQNAQLGQKYAAVFNSYPTLLFLNAEGMVLTQMTGYGGETPEDWIKQADQQLVGALPLIIQDPSAPKDPQAPPQ